MSDEIPLFPDDLIKEPKGHSGAFSFADEVEEPPLDTRTALIDGDMLIYACCYSAARKEGFEAIKKVWDGKVNTILSKSRAIDKVIFLTNGPCNFRYKIYPDYKGCRQKSKPEFYNRLRKWSIEKRGAVMVHNAEADDALCYSHENNSGNPDIALNHTIICTDDKDLDMVPGWHYRLRTQECYYVDNEFGELVVVPTERDKKIKAYGPVAFYYQMLLGDSTDGILGLGKVADETRDKYGLRNAKGCGQVCAYTILSNAESVEDASYIVASAYRAKYGAKWYNEYLLQARLLWMQTYEGEIYTPPEEILNYWRKRHDAECK